MTDMHEEGDLRITASGSASLRKFDDPATHQALGPMKAVDFIIDRPRDLIFLEMKDPDNPSASAASRREFRTEMLSERHDQDLKYKFRDSFLYEWASGRATKPIIFVVLVELSSLSPAELLARTDQLRHKLPARAAAPADWSQHFLDDCIVLNVAEWNKRFPSIPIERISAGQV